MIVDFDIEGFHYYPDPPKEVEFLQYEHRHLFQIRCGWNVEDSNREIEIFMQEDLVKAYISEEYGIPAKFKNMSCEMIAEDILKKFDCSFVEVYEDGKGGARIEVA